MHADQHVYNDKELVWIRPNCLSYIVQTVHEALVNLSINCSTIKQPIVKQHNESLLVVVMSRTKLCPHQDAQFIQV